MKKYKIEFAPSFGRDLKKFKRNKKITDLVRLKLSILGDDPFHKSLRTHRVKTRQLGEIWSSRVTGDLRLIWQFHSSKGFVVIAIRLQGHDTAYS